MSGKEERKYIGLYFCAPTPIMLAQSIEDSREEIEEQMPRVIAEYDQLKAEGYECVPVLLEIRPEGLPISYQQIVEFAAFRHEFMEAE